MATYQDILPDPDEQLFIAGQKGAGKTTLIRRLLALPKLKNELVIIIDSKPDWDNLAPMFGKKKR